MFKLFKTGLFVLLGYISIQTLVYAQTPIFSTKVNEALKAQLDYNGKWKAILFADGTSQTTAGAGGDVTGQASSVDSEISLFSGTTGKVIKRATTTGIVKATSGIIGAAVAGDFPTLNQNTTGNAATVTTNANLTGHVTSTGNAAILGSFSSANLLGALSDETGTGVVVFGTSPAFTTQITTPSIVSAGALGITPAGGSNVNITLATTGDFAVNTSQLYVDTSAGYVGIGTAVPGEKLHIASGNILLSNNQFLKGQNVAATARSLIGINANNAIIIGADGQAVGIGAALTDALSTLDVKGSMVVGTYAGVNNAPSNGLAVSGSVGIGTSTPSAQLHTTGTVRMQNFGAGTATFDANGNISSVSDERLKNILGNFSSGLSEILQIKPIVYKWNDKSGLETINNYVGFSAQNLSKYIPEAVSINSEGYLSVSDRAVIAALVNAVKTLSDEVDSLKLKLSLPLTSHTVVANTDITKLGKTNYAKTLRTPVLQGEETWGYIEEGTESKAQAVSAEDAFILVPGYTQNYLRDEVKIEFILEGEDVKQVTKIVPVYEQVFVKLQKKLKENVSLNSETGTFYKNVEVPKLVYKMKQGVSFDEVTKVYMRDETPQEALIRMGKEIVSIIPKL